VIPIKILILAANPKGSDRLRLDEEVREITEALEQSQHRDDFEVIPRWAVLVDDLQKLLHDHNPQIIHFSGHGNGAEGLVLENELGRGQPVSTQALAGLFKLFPSVRCVCLNACYSEVQAEEVCKYIPCVVGMNQAIGDKAAIQFAKGFYRALGAHRTFKEAYEFGLNAIDLQNIPDVSIPAFKSNQPQGSLVHTLFPAAASADLTPLLENQPTMSPNPAMPSDDGAKDVVQPAQAQPMPAQSSQTQSPTFGNISINGSTSNSNLFTLNQSGGDIYSDQSRKTLVAVNTDLQAALELLQQLKQEVGATPMLEADDKAETQARIKVLEDELNKPEPKKDLIDRVVTKLKKGLEGVETLAGPVMRVAALVAQAGLMV
jgi:hypothetical protein